MYRQVGVLPTREVGVGVVHVNAVVVGQRVVGRVDARLVLVEVGHAVRAADAARTFHAEFALQRRDERREDVEHQRTGRGEHFADRLIDDRIDQDRPHAFGRVGVADTRRGRMRLFLVVDERDAEGIEFDAL